MESSPTSKALFRLFIRSVPTRSKTDVKKFKYAMLNMRHYINSRKLHNRSITLSDFVNKLNKKYNIENIDLNSANS